MKGGERFCFSRSAGTRINRPNVSSLATETLFMVLSEGQNERLE
jgi:hypothetical protein